jgi:hypothetical protein
MKIYGPVLWKTDIYVNHMFSHFPPIVIYWRKIRVGRGPETGIQLRESSRLRPAVRSDHPSRIPEPAGYNSGRLPAGSRAGRVPSAPVEPLFLPATGPLGSTAIAGQWETLQSRATYTVRRPKFCVFESAGTGYLYAYPGCRDTVATRCQRVADGSSTASQLSSRSRQSSSPNFRRGISYTRFA